MPGPKCDLLKVRAVHTSDRGMFTDLLIFMLYIISVNLNQTEQSFIQSYDCMVLGKQYAEYLWLLQ